MTHVAEAWAERAAIMEFDGGLTRAEAEEAAWCEMAKIYGDDVARKAQDEHDA